MFGDQPVQLPNAGQPLGQLSRCQPLAGFIHQIHVVMVFGPVIRTPDMESVSDQ